MGIDIMGSPAGLSMPSGNRGRIGAGDLKLLGGGRPALYKPNGVKSVEGALRDQRGRAGRIGRSLAWARRLGDTRKLLEKIAGRHCLQKLNPLLA